MKYAITFGLLSLLLGLSCFRYPSATVILIWASISFAITAIGYAKVDPQAFCKRPDGTIPLAPLVINLPFLGYTWLVWHLYRVFNREESYIEVNDDIVIGRRLLAGEVPGEFDHYVDLTAEFVEPAAIRRYSSYYSFPILDAGVPSMKGMHAAVVATGKGKLFIHCAQGHGRTGLFTLAALLNRSAITNADEGLVLLKSLRPRLDLNREQFAFVERYFDYARNL